MQPLLLELSEGQELIYASVTRQLRYSVMLFSLWVMTVNGVTNWLRDSISVSDVLYILVQVEVGEDHTIVYDYYYEPTLFGDQH